MTWVVDRRKREAMNKYGYLIRWAKGPGGLFYNGYAPSGKHVDAGYDREIVKAMCDIHREKTVARRVAR